jgi:hypothetical protein
VIGTVFGVLIQGLIQTIIMFQGTLNSWWTKIVVGLLTLLFIGMQSLFVQRRRGRVLAKSKQPAPSVPVGPPVLTESVKS